jgi:formylglycine-generating enzyme required for sulfatase activity
MKIRSIRSIIIAAVIPCAVSAALTATVSATITLDMIAIGNAGNTADTTTYGSVSYAYDIGKTEVTTAQYVAFLNATASTVDTYNLYNADMANMGGIGSGIGISQTGGGIANFTYSVTGGGENRPVAFVSWFDAARFSNWMTTGQGTTTETGSYTLAGAVSGSTVARNVIVGGYYIPTENEWYKAAYYNPGTSTYSLFPNGQATITTADANYANAVGTTTDVGTYSGDPSSYGTLDQGGNVYEVMTPTIDSDLDLVIRGGAYLNSESRLKSTTRQPGVFTSDETISTGFRVSVVPEPSSALLAMLGGSFLLLRRKR